MSAEMKPRQPGRTPQGRKKTAQNITGGAAFNGLAPPVKKQQPIPPSVARQQGYGFWHFLVRYSGVSAEWLGALAEVNSREQLLVKVNGLDSDQTPAVIVAARRGMTELVEWMVEYFGTGLVAVRTRNTNLLNACIDADMPVALCRKVRDQFPHLESSQPGGVLCPYESACVAFASSGRIIPDDFLYRRNRSNDHVVVASAVRSMDSGHISPVNVWNILSTGLPGEVPKAALSGLNRLVEIGNGYRFPPYHRQRILTWMRTFVICRLFKRNLFGVKMRSSVAHHFLAFSRKPVLYQVAICLMDDCAVHHNKVARLLASEANIMPNACVVSKASVDNAIEKVKAYVAAVPEHAVVGERTISAYRELVPIIKKPVYMKRDIVGIRHLVALSIMAHTRNTKGGWARRNSNGTVVQMDPLPKLPSEMWLLVFEKLGTCRSMLARN